MGSHIQGAEQDWSGDIRVRAGMGEDGVLYSDVQCTMGNGHKGKPCEQTDVTKNIVSLQLRWWVVTFHVTEL